MKISEVMSRHVVVASPDDSIQKVAMTMGRLDTGVLPVGEDDRLVGMITDRDIATRGVAEGRDPSTKVRDVMTAEVRYCFEDEDLGHVCDTMAELQVRRLPVLNRQKRLVGIVSLGDIAERQSPDKTGTALRGISHPSDQHNQASGVDGSGSARHH